MSKESTFTPIGAEATKLISKILETKSVKTHEVNSYTKEPDERSNDNSPDFNWRYARQLDLFEVAVGG